MHRPDRRLKPVTLALLIVLFSLPGTGLLQPAFGQGAAVADSSAVSAPADSIRWMVPPPAPQADDTLTATENSFEDEFDRSFGSSGPKIDMQQVNMSHGVPLRKNPTKAFIMSLMVPGLGQFYTHNYIKSVAFFGTDVGMIFALLYQDRLSRENYQMASATIVDGSPTQVVEWYMDRGKFYKSDRNKLIWWTAGITLLAATDAYVEAHLFDFHIDPTLGVTPAGDGVTTGLKITFRR